MPLFRSRNKEVSPISPLLSPNLASRSSSVKLTDSGGSAKFKLFKKKGLTANAVAPPITPSNEVRLHEPSLILDRLKKRVSTIVEADNDDYKGSGSESDFESLDLDGSGNLDRYSFDTSEIDESSGDDLEDFEEHSHAIKARGKVSLHQFAVQLSAIMGYCVGSRVPNKDQLKALANEELKRTYSLINADHKIHQLPNSTTSTQSVIDTSQMELIDYLRNKSSTWLKACKYKTEEASITTGRTLFERYGVVSDIVGKGAYGVIKVIDRDPEGSSIELARYNNVLYAVKEIQRRSTKESNEAFIERVISEFVISSTLNNKHIVKTVDLMVTVPVEKTSDFRNLKFNQVMECTTGGNLFTYLTTVVDKNSRPVNFMSLDEIDCFTKQISKGLKYMHQHGVAHCDLKLENILLTYKDVSDTNGSNAKIVLKISDYGKSNVFRTKFDTAEQYFPRSLGPIGSEPYMAPEEHSDIKSYSLIKKDCWSLGILILVLFNIRRHYFSGSSKIEYITTAQIDDTDKNNVHQDEHPGKPTLIQEYSSGYLWQSTDMKHHFLVNNEKRYKDKVFDEYTKTKMVADYDPKTKEWLLKKSGGFRPIEELFWYPREQSGEDDKRKDEDEDDLSELRRMFIYKLLDLDPHSRPTVDQFLKSDWMTAVENCV